MNQIALKIAYKFYYEKLISFDDIEAYTYSIEMALVRIIGWFLLVFFSTIIGWFKELFGYLICFSALRIYGGGFHCKTLTGCLFISTISLLIPIILYRYTSDYYYIYQVLLVVFILFAFVIGSVNNKSIAWDVAEYKKAKFMNRIIVCNEVALMIILSFTSFNRRYLLFMALGIIFATISMIIEFIKMKGGTCYEDYEEGNA